MTEWVVHALLTADRVIEERNGKKSLIGVFDHFNLPSFPSVGLPPWYIYASVSNLSEGRHRCVVNIVSDDSHEVLFSAAGELMVKDGTRPMELSMPVSIVFPAAGLYVVTLHLDGTEALSRTLSVKSVSTASRPRSTSLDESDALDVPVNDLMETERKYRTQGPGAFKTHEQLKQELFGD